MNPIALAGPVVEPVSLAEMKTYLRLDGAEEDEIVSALVVAARVTVELQARLALIAQSWRCVLSAWPGERRVRLPRQPVLAVEAVRVSNDSGPETILAPEQYRIENDGEVAHLVIGRGAPEPLGSPPRIEIDLSCGFGASPSAVPEPLRLAIRRLVAFWFEHRGDERSPGAPPLPADVALLLAPFIRARLT